ncbi:Acyl-CoA thioesterase 2 [Syntrophobacter sp. SbD1]|nr:Acyl-CoA thioesterase 2 [Syntrophobacter sp. SbD1]
MKPCSEGNVLEELLELLKLEQIDENIFRGQSQDLGFGNVYGGQVLGQALSAAYRTVPPERRAHSLHAYFLRSGDVEEPIVYNVDPIRDGKSFTTRRVVAVQKGRAIFNMAASFQIDEPGFDHQDPAPSVPGPEGLASEHELVKLIADQIPAPIRERLLCRPPIEIRPVNPMNIFAPEKRKPLRYNWVKTIDKMPDDPSIHQYLLAYASDYGLVTTTLYPHGQSAWQPAMQVASLDHAMWFHRKFRMDDWLLYEMQSPNACNARGLAYGKVFDRQGALVATVAQEGLIRYRGKL